MKNNFMYNTFKYTVYMVKYLKKKTKCSFDLYRLFHPHKDSKYLIGYNFTFAFLKPNQSEWMSK